MGGWSVSLGQVSNCLTSGWKGGEAVGVDDAEVARGAGLPPLLDFYDAVYLMWPVDAFHGAEDFVVFAPDFCLSRGDVAQMDGGVGHDGSFLVGGWGDGS